MQFTLVVIHQRSCIRCCVAQIVILVRGRYHAADFLALLGRPVIRPSILNLLIGTLIPIAKFR